MPMFRKRPVVIQAEQWTGANVIEMYNFLEGTEHVAETFESYGNNFYINHSKVKGGLIIKTLEGEHKASINDWIIKGINGEFYPCKPNIFKRTYEPLLVTPDLTTEWQCKESK